MNNLIAGNRPGKTLLAAAFSTPVMIGSPIGRVPMVTPSYHMNLKAGTGAPIGAPLSLGSPDRSCIETRYIFYPDGSQSGVVVPVEGRFTPELSILMLDLTHKEAVSVSGTPVVMSEPEMRFEDWDFAALEAFMGSSADVADERRQASLSSSMWDEIEV